jgi:glycosyltransferase involved in cell wall biosynthesis
VSVAPCPGLVSIVVASYNHATYLPQRMESLLAQTYADIEIIVIDDRSPDNSVEVLQRYADHPKVQLVIRENNGGWVTVSNQGVQIARGEYVLFANCDDACEPTMVAELVAGMRRSPTVGISFCRSLLVDERSAVIGDDFRIREPAFRERCREDTVLTGAEMRRFLFESCVIPNLSAALIRRECFETAGLLSGEYRVVCDWDLFFRIFERYDASYIAAPLNWFRQHATTIRSSTKERIVYDEYLRLLLPQVHRVPMTVGARLRARLQVMAIWSLHLVAPRVSGLRDFPHHAALVLSLDPVSLLVLPVALLRRAAQVLRTIAGGHPAAAT